MSYSSYTARKSMYGIQPDTIQLEKKIKKKPVFKIEDPKKFLTLKKIFVKKTKHTPQFWANAIIKYLNYLKKGGLYPYIQIDTSGAIIDIIPTPKKGSYIVTVYQSKLPDTLFDILKIRPTNDVKKIKKAYNQLALQTHPDRAVNEEEKKARTILMQQINEAKEVLIDNKTREEYMKKILPKERKVENRIPLRSNEALKEYLEGIMLNLCFQKLNVSWKAPKNKSIAMDVRHLIKPEVNYTDLPYYQYVNSLIDQSIQFIQSKRKPSQRKCVALVREIYQAIQKYKNSNCKVAPAAISALSAVGSKLAIEVCGCKNEFCSSA